MSEEKTLGFCCANCRLPVLKHHWRIEYATTVIDTKAARPVQNQKDFNINMKRITLRMETRICSELCMREFAEKNPDLKVIQEVT
jgi:hypothetical protein